MDKQTKTSRFDIYTAVHKGLRAFMADVLTTVGRVDPEDESDVSEALDRVRALIDICRDHLINENRFLHPAMDERRPGSSASTANDHAQQEGAFERLNSSILAVEHSTGRDRDDGMLDLYRNLALSVADNFQHMDVEERHNQTVLWDAYQDDELQSIHDRLLASVPPDQMRVYLRWILPFNSHAERAAILSKLQFIMPPEAFARMLEMVRLSTTDKDWQKLEADLFQSPAFA